MLAYRAIRRSPFSNLNRSRIFSSVSICGNATSFHDVSPINEVNVPLISPRMQEQLFPPQDSLYAAGAPNPTAVQISRDHLEMNGLYSPNDSAPTRSAVQFDLPPLQGPTPDHHFRAISSYATEPYLDQSERLARVPLPAPLDPFTWQLRAGWTRYHSDGSFTPVAAPEAEEALVFDVETLPYQTGDYPTMAIAWGATSGEWYAWCSPWLTGDDPNPDHLIPLADTEGIVVGHNVLFDRARVATEYALERPRARYIDTLSLNCAVSGLTSVQRPAWMQYHKEKREGKSKSKGEKAVSSVKNGVVTPAPIGGFSSTAPPSEATVSWKDVTSLNSLEEVARLHCGIEIDKSVRNDFMDMKTTVENLRTSFHSYISYCANDVLITLRVYQKLFPRFRELCPHPVSFAGVLLMSQPFLPVDEHWPAYLKNAEDTYEEMLSRVKKSLEQLAEEARLMVWEMDDNGRYKWESDLWLRQLDWQPKAPKRGAVKRATAKPRKSKVAPEVNRIRIAQAKYDETSMEDYVHIPRWLSVARPNPDKPYAPPLVTSAMTAMLLRLRYRSYPVVYSKKSKWLFAVPHTEVDSFVPEPREQSIDLSLLEGELPLSILEHYALFSVPPATKTSAHCGRLLTKFFHSQGLITADNESLLEKIFENLTLVNNLSDLAEDAGYDPKCKDLFDYVNAEFNTIIDEAAKASPEEIQNDPWLAQLDWKPVVLTAPLVAKPLVMPDLTSTADGSGSGAPMSDTESLVSSVATDLDSLKESPVSTDNENGSSVLDSISSSEYDSKTITPVQTAQHIWPAWYHAVYKKGEVDIQPKQVLAPLLLKLKWDGYPLARSKEFRWMYRVPKEDFTPEKFDMADPHLRPLHFTEIEDVIFQEDTDAVYFRLPHVDGPGKNVGSPFTKPFVPYFEQGLLTSDYPLAKEALELNAMCSYWTSARERILNQMVVWQKDGGEKKQGMILPQVIPMGTITRRSVEKTWLTASNAKKTRVGSELKSMIRAPPGYSIVGADVDSEELWICSVMGDAQFGFHGATAIGWMTLEGTKSAGTDLHSKTASILDISRDSAKVFNYSRIYGAGVKHATQLLMKANPNLSQDEAISSARRLYSQTKGLISRGMFTPGRAFWNGGTESYVFNMLEGVAHSANPRTPALGCGLTDALSQKYLLDENGKPEKNAYLPSRINWVVQSSGVDYLHMLMVSMEYLSKKYDISARYMISVHDEIRYLVKDEDKYRAALALQISNLWVRAMFSYKLQIGNLPESIAFFSAVDIDHCFRKEVNMSCVTPSNKEPIPEGESVDIEQLLAKTGGSLLKAEGTIPDTLQSATETSYVSEDSSISFRSTSTNFLLAQALNDHELVRRVWFSERNNHTIEAGEPLYDELFAYARGLAGTPKEEPVAKREGPKAEKMTPSDDDETFDERLSGSELSEITNILKEFPFESDIPFFDIDTKSFKDGDVVMMSRDTSDTYKTVQSHVL